MKATEAQLKGTLWNSPTTWKAYYDRARQNEELTQDEQERVCSGLVTLEQTLGTDFLRRIFCLDLPKSRERHPLAYALTGSAPSVQLHLGRFGKTLKSLEEFQGFKTLITLLKDAGQFNHAVAQAEVAARIQRVGYNIELEPKVGGKKADILARDGSDEFFVEVSTVGEGDESKYARETAHAIWSLVQPNGCIAFGRIYRIINQKERDKYCGEIEKVIEEVKTQGHCHKIEHGGVFDIFIGLPGKAEELDMCLRSKGMKRECCGPQLTADQVARVVTRFRKEAGRPPHDKPRIIVVYANDFTPFYMVRDQLLEDLAGGIEEVIGSKDNIILLVLVVPEGCFENRNKYVCRDFGNNRTFVQRPLVRDSRENILVVRNLNARFHCPSKIVGAFVHA